MELKSKTLSEKLLDGLVKVTEQEAAKFKGKPHALPIIKFVNQFIEDNPLCCCSEEIAQVKKTLNLDKDRIKLSQKTSTIGIQIYSNFYFFKTRLKVPPDYPNSQVT